MSVYVVLTSGNEQVFEDSSWADADYAGTKFEERGAYQFAYRLEQNEALVIVRTKLHRGYGTPQTWTEVATEDVAYFRPREWTAVRRD